MIVHSIRNNAVIEEATGEDAADIEEQEEVKESQNQTGKEEESPKQDLADPEGGEKDKKKKKKPKKSKKDSGRTPYETYKAEAIKRDLYDIKVNDNRLYDVKDDMETQYCKYGRRRKDFTMRVKVSKHKTSTVKVLNIISSMNCEVAPHVLSI